VIPDEAVEASADENVVAAVIDNNRVKVIWSEDECYQSSVMPQLYRLRELYHFHQNQALLFSFDLLTMC
jgi:hypothetical protein